MCQYTALGLEVRDLSEAFVYSNDDMFLGGRRYYIHSGRLCDHIRFSFTCSNLPATAFSASDFFTPLYGPVLRMSTTFLVGSDEEPEARVGVGVNLTCNIRNC